jgi:hypothetical protein
MGNTVKVHFLVALSVLFLNSSAFAQVTYRPSTEAAIQQGLNLRVAIEGPQIVLGEIEAATNEVGRNAQKTYSAFRNAQKEIPKEIIVQYTDLIDIVWNIARLNAMDKGVYAQVEQAVHMQTLLRNQRILKDNIFTICNSAGVLCDPYANFLSPAPSPAPYKSNRSSNIVDKPDSSRKSFRLEGPERTGFYTSEAKQGLNKVCYYTVAGTTYAHNTSSLSICPLSMKF